MEGYQQFLESKRVLAKPLGFEADAINASLFQWQRDIVRWALRLGRAAIFAECGLGKTLMQLEWASRVAQHTGRPVLILTPLAVAKQTLAEAGKFGVVTPAAVHENGERVPAREPHLAITNYQKLHKFDPSVFAGVVLDESSILKSYMGATKRQLIDSFAETPYRLCCTATPAPNDHMEIGNHADFLGVMPANEMLMRWFCNDQAKAGVYRLKAHGEADFWRWVSSWAACIGKPSDLGYSDDGFELPALELIDCPVSVDVTDGAGDSLWRNDAVNATGIHKEMRKTARDRAAAVAKIIADDPAGPWIVWCNTDYEADELRAAIPDAVEVRGSHKDSLKEKRLAEFAEGKIRVLVSKPTVAGFGLNWQHCHKIALVGLSYSFEQFYQVVRRCWRFGQKESVKAHVVFAETEGEVLSAVRRKQADHETMKAAMCGSMREHGMGIGKRDLRMDFDHRTEESESGKWQMHLGDCVEVTKTLSENSIDFTIFSPPFALLYIYSDSYRDMGNCSDSQEFFRHFGFLAPELLRVTVPGRLCAIHCKDLPMYRNRDGACGLIDFPGDIVRTFTGAGWVFHSRVTIWKCPVIERERTNNNGLLHKTVCRDSSQIRQGMADYLLVFRKNPIEDNLSEKPIVRESGFTEYIGDSSADPRSTDFHPCKFARNGHTESGSIDIWRRYAEPVWWDIDQMDVLNYQQARDGKDEKHICPLQLGLIGRAVQLWTNPCDTVLSPFAGIGSEGYQSLLMKRKFVGIELKESYWNVACRNLARAEREANQKTLFEEMEADDGELAACMA